MEGGGNPGPVGSLPAAVGTAHLHGALQSCPGLLVSGLLQPLGHLPASAREEGGQSGLQVGSPGQQSGGLAQLLTCCVTLEQLFALSGPQFPLLIIREGLDPYRGPFSNCGEELWGVGRLAHDLQAV